MNPIRRLCLSASAALPLAALLATHRSAAAASESDLQSFHAIVDAKHTGAEGELVSGKPHFRTLNQALIDAPGGSREPCRILLRSGRYYEKVILTRANVHLIGESRDSAILTFDETAQRSGTDRCATLIIRSKDFRAENLTIENGFDYIANDLKAADDETRVASPQAVAVMTDRGADRSLFINVKIAGYQDTLFVNVGRSLFRDCRITGNIDFIFGAGQSVFETCEIVARTRGKTTARPFGFLVAPSTKIRDKFGLVFLRCKLIREIPEIPAGTYPLGRPWHPSGDPDAIGYAAFIECYMDDHITSEAWASMSNTKNGQRITFLPEDSRFLEYKSSGPGAVVNDKRRQLSAEEAAQITTATVLGDWKV